MGLRSGLVSLRTEYLTWCRTRLTFQTARCTAKTSYSTKLCGIMPSSWWDVLHSPPHIIMMDRSQPPAATFACAAPDLVKIEPMHGRPASARAVLFADSLFDGWPQMLEGTV